MKIRQDFAVLPLPHPSSPSLPLFSFFWIFSKANEGEGQPTPLYRGGGPAAPQPGGLGGRPPGCRAAGSQGPVRNFFSSFFADKPLPPGSRTVRPPVSGAAGVYFCKFPNRKYIFVKNGNKKYKNKKTAPSEARSFQSTRPAHCNYGYKNFNGNQAAGSHINWPAAAATGDAHAAMPFEREAPSSTWTCN